MIKIKDKPLSKVFFLALSSLLFSAFFLISTTENETYFDYTNPAVQPLSEEESIRYLQNQVEIGEGRGSRIFASKEESSQFRVGYPSATKTRYILELNSAVPNVRSKVMGMLSMPPYSAENVRGFERILENYLVVDIAKNSGFDLDEEESAGVSRGGGEVGRLWSSLVDTTTGDTHLQLILHKEKDGVTINNQDKDISPYLEKTTTCYTAPPQLWGKDRLDQPSLPLDQVFGYPTDGGSSVTVYVIDEGVYSKHEDYNNRFTAYYDCIGRPCTKLAGDAHSFLCTKNTYGEGYHGTFVAGICCGKTSGVASSASIVSLRALSCAGNGLLSDYLAAIDTAVAHCYANDYPINRRCVISASMHNPYSHAINAAADEAVEKHNVVFVNSAGNKNSDACHYSPGSAKGTITVAASDIEDRRASYSNHGDCVDMIAPGSNIYSAFYKSESSGDGGVAVKDDMYAMGDGTSWAAPFVAGAAALYLQVHPTASASSVKSELIRHSRVTLEGKYPLLYIPGGCGEDETSEVVASDARLVPTDAPTGSPTVGPTKAPITQEEAMEKLGIGEICERDSECNSNACVLINDRFVCTSPIYSN